MSKQPIQSTSNYFTSIISSSLGNILEWYDFGLFTIFSSLFSQLFFPTNNAHVSLIVTFSVFAIGFFCRPLGAFVFGYLGDKHGRAKTLRLSILMISLPTLIIGFLPTYQEVGIIAPILLTLIRIWQGMSIGGEYSGSIIYMAEVAPIKYRATVTSLANMGSNMGILLATLIGAICSSFFTDSELQTWGWRVPYLISGFLCLFIYTMRLQIEETAVFEQLKNKKLLVNNPIKTVLSQNISQLIRTLGLVCMGSTFYYFCFIYIPIFLSHQLQFSIQKISILTSFLIATMIILVPLAGLMCDWIGRRKLFLFNTMLVALIVIPGFYILQLNYLLAIILTLLLFTITSSLEQGTTSVAIVEYFPLATRYTGLSLAYNLGNGFLGGTVPLVCEWLLTKTHFILAPAFYIALCAIITGLVVFFFLPETRPA